MKKITYCVVDMSMPDYIPEGVMLIRPHRPISKFRRLVKAITHGHKLKAPEIIGWECECASYDVVILFDTHTNYSYYAQKIENAVNVNTRLILYLWNPVLYSDDFINISSRWEIWSFSAEDSVNKGFLFGNTFFNPKMIPTESLPPTKGDVFFAGTDKGRRDIICGIQKRLEDLNITTDIRIVDNRKAIFSKKYFKYITYKKLLSIAKGTKLLLEIVQDGQSGITLRCMEALFLKKKLITNY